MFANPLGGCPIKSDQKGPMNMGEPHKRMTHMGKVIHGYLGRRNIDQTPYERFLFVKPVGNQIGKLCVGQPNVGDILRYLVLNPGAE